MGNRRITPDDRYMLTNNHGKVLATEALVSLGQKGLLPSTAEIYPSDSTPWSPLWKYRFCHDNTSQAERIDSWTRILKSNSNLAPITRISLNRVATFKSPAGLHLKAMLDKDMAQWAAQHWADSVLRSLGTSDIASIGRKSRLLTTFLTGSRHVRLLDIAKTSFNLPQTSKSSRPEGCRSEGQRFDDMGTLLRKLRAGSVTARQATATRRRNSLDTMISHSAIAYAPTLSSSSRLLDNTALHGVPFGFSGATHVGLPPPHGLRSAYGESPQDDPVPGRTGSEFEISHSGTIIIDGNDLGNWLLRHLADALLMSPSGTIGPDARIAPPQPGSALAF